tara:strand:- start:675 stop:1109 length:435 start_codon:yes stop_codon:yes gene_type:complete
MAVSTSSGFHTYSSWGRTRRPKNLNGASSTAVVTLHSTNSSAPTTVAHGYATENQRYLHLSILGNNTDNHLTVYVWHHAFQAWSKLTMPSDLDGTATDALNVVQITAPTARTNYILDIAGADRVAFVANGAATTFTLYAACSTF